MRSDRSKKDSLNVLGKQELQAPAYSTNKNARPIGIDRKDLKKEMQKASEEVQSSNRRKHAQTEEPEEFYYEDLPEETTSKKSRRKKSDKTDKNKKNNGKSPKLKGVHLAGTIAMYVQAALSLFLFILLLLLDVLPWWLLTIAIIVVFAIWIAVLFLQMSKQKKKHIIGLIVSVVMCLLLGFGDYYLMLTNNMLNKITRNKDYDITTYNIVVRADDPATSLKDAAKYTYGIQIGFEPDNVFYVLDEIQKESGTEPTTKDYNSCTDQGKDLLDKKVDAIIYNDNFTSTIAEHIDGYDSKIKVLKQIKIKKKKD
ncbi:MAG: hypothetical protein HUJ75_08730, partial [Parasporobacterium sp.]|nr:hypothetical protein [Parasporobacterium sp.]